MVPMEQVMLAILVANAPAPGVAPRETLLNFLRQKLEKCIALEHTYYAALNEAGFKDEDISYCDEDSVLHCSRCNRNFQSHDDQEIIENRDIITFPAHADALAGRRR